MSTMDRSEFWIPLESNPEVLTKFAHKLGVPEEWTIGDVFGFEPELLDMVPKPVAALILLFPVGISRPDLPGETVEPDTRPQVFFMTQNVGNACGTVALIHAVANSPIDVPKESLIGTVIHKGQEMSPTERGAALEKADELSVAHKESASEGQTSAPPSDSNTLMHFVSLVHRDGRLWELDGTRSGLIDHGPTEPDNFLFDAAKVCRRIVEANPGEMRFSVLAITGENQTCAES